MRIAHTMIRVTDLERSLDFYTRVLGMKLQRRLDFPEGRFTLAFVGCGDVRAVVEQIRARGGTITREPKAMNAGTMVIAFAEDPDGYAIELVPAH